MADALDPRSGRTGSPRPSQRVAIIPARLGSKRLPGKNVRDFLGRPALSYPVAAARRSGLFDRVIVSTDSAEIAAIARACDAEVPFMRPAELADDHCSTSRVVRHAIEELERHQRQPIEYVCCLYPTAVLITEQQLDAAFQRLRDSPSHQYCFTVSAFEHAIERALRIDAMGSIQPVRPEFALARTQDLDSLYFDAGQFYWGTAAAYRAQIPLFSAASLPYVLLRHEFVDIDTREDWDFAEAIAMGKRAQGSPAVADAARRAVKATD